MAVKWRRDWRLSGWGVKTGWRGSGWGLETMLETWQLGTRDNDVDLAAWDQGRHLKCRGRGVETTLAIKQLGVGRELESVVWEW